jgi:pimeloyl-ACP methyl ester carboxylesterase
MKRVDPDSMTRFILATYGGIITPTATRSPVLVLVGEKETPVAKSMARRLQREIPGARGATVRRLGHVWNLQNPDLFVAVVRTWVRDPVACLCRSAEIRLVPTSDSTSRQADSPNPGGSPQ